MLIYPSHISLLAALQQDKTSTKILLEYMNYANIFFIILAVELSKKTGIIKYVIELVKSKPPLYRLIYGLSLIELETLRVYI